MLKIFEQLSDSELIARLLQNDEQAVEYLFFYRCHLIFQRLIKNIFSYQIEQEELITDFYLYLSENDWIKLRNFEQKASLNTWLTIVAVRFFTKKKMAMTNLDEKETLIELNEKQYIFLEEELPFQISKYELLDAVQQISNPRYRWVLLAQLRGLEVEDIAKELNTNVVNIYNLIKRAKMALKTLLQ